MQVSRHFTDELAESVENGEKSFGLCQPTCGSFLLLLL